MRRKPVGARVKAVRMRRIPVQAPPHPAPKRPANHANETIAPSLCLIETASLPGAVSRSEGYFAISTGMGDACNSLWLTLPMYSLSPLRPRLPTISRS